MKEKTQKQEQLLRSFNGLGNFRQYLEAKIWDRELKWYYNANYRGQETRENSRNYGTVLEKVRIVSLKDRKTKKVAFTKFLPKSQKNDGEWNSGLLKNQKIFREINLHYEDVDFTEFVKKKFIAKECNFQIVLLWWSKRLYVWPDFFYFRNAICEQSRFRSPDKLESNLFYLKHE